MGKGPSQSSCRQCKPVQTDHDLRGPKSSANMVIIIELSNQFLRFIIF